jgi:hypothetical protein
MSAPSRLYRFMAEFSEYCRTQSGTEFPPSERLTCRVIVEHMSNDTLTCWISNRRGAEIAGQSEVTFRRNIPAIERHGILRKTAGRAGRGTANRYHGNLGFSEKTVSERPFDESVKRSESASKTVSARPRTVRNKTAPPATPPDGASPAALEARQTDIAERLDLLRLDDLEAFAARWSRAGFSLRVHNPYRCLDAGELAAAEAVLAQVEATPERTTA